MSYMIYTGREKSIREIFKLYERDLPRVLHTLEIGKKWRMLRPLNNENKDENYMPEIHKRIWYDGHQNCMQYR